jgi:hypothetical protein
MLDLASYAIPSLKTLLDFIQSTMQNPENLEGLICSPTVGIDNNI